MNRLFFYGGFCLILALIMASPALSDCGVCGSGGEEKGSHSHVSEKKGCYSEKKGSYSDASEKADDETCFGGVCALAHTKDGVKEITYEQFQIIRASGEDYVLLDVMSEESYEKGHIEDAESFPVGTINIETTSDELDKDDKIVVYCAGSSCSVSTKAAHRLMALGFENVLDYKGGLEEWQARGHELED